MNLKHERKVAFVLQAAHPSEPAAATGSGSRQRWQLQKEAGQHHGQ